MSELFLRLDVYFTATIAITGTRAKSDLHGEEKNQ